MIKHQLHELGHPLEDIKIMWRKNVIKLSTDIVYKLSESGSHVYLGAATGVKDDVEELVRDWIEMRVSEERQ